MLALFNLIRKPWLLIAVAVLGAFAAGFFKGHDSATDSFNAAQYEARIAALKEQAKRKEEIVHSRSLRIAELENALREIDADQTPITGSGAECPIDVDFLRRLTVAYGADWSDDPPVPSKDNRRR